MTPLSLSDTDPAELAVDAIVIGLHSTEAANGSGPASRPERSGPASRAERSGPASRPERSSLLLAPGAESVAVAFEGRLADTLSLLGATGAAGEVTKLATLGTVTAPVIAAVGLGPVPADGAIPTETLRRAAASGIRALAGADRVAVALPVPDTSSRESGSVEDGSAWIRAIAEGALLGTYRFAGYKTMPVPGRREPVQAVTLHVADATERTAKAEVRRAAIVAAAVARTRDWVNTAPNELRPPEFAAAVAQAAAEAGLGVEVLDEKALRKAGYGGILAVGMGSDAPPRLVTISYAPKGATTSVALVGKGITFDTGGYAVKPPQGMWEMKSDMSGAAAVAAVLIAVAALKPKVRVTAYVPMAENMISGSSYRPGDVISMYGGKRVEVLNPDAEGRLIVADAMVRAQEDEPDYLLEVSTLTGGQVVALGKRVAGVMGDERLCERVRAAGDRVGEPAWPMPIPDEVRKGMDSDVADISQVNSGMDRAGHMLQGGAFLREFVSDGRAWAHIDIAGPAYHSAEPTGYWTKGGTGVPARLLLDLIEDIAANG